MKAGDIVRTRHNLYHLLDGASQGGFGVVVPAVRERDGARVAIKFRTELSEAEHNDPLADEFAENIAQRFNDEITLVKRLSGQPYYPEYFEKGAYDGLPFFVMEWLTPLTKESWPPKSEKERIRFVVDLCDAVQGLHDLGYVHYDIKPSNLMFRKGGVDGGHWVLVDFGSAHLKEDESRVENPLTRSMLSDGRRLFPSTPGYADPVWRLHSVSFDIYSIGQVIRDLFDEHVPLVWGRIINRCISRNPDLRYKLVSDIEKDVRNVKELGRDEMAHCLYDVRIRAVTMQAEMMEDCPLRITESEFKFFLKKNADAEKRFVVGKYEMMIDLQKLPCHTIEVTQPIFLENEKLIVIRGPGVLRVDLEFCPNDESRTIVLIDNVTLVNRSRRSPESDMLTYCIGESCYVNLSELRRTAPLKGWTHKTSLSGFSFIKCHGPDKISEILADMDSDLCSDMLYTTEEMYGEGPYEDKPGLGTYLHESGWFNSAMGVMQKKWCSELKLSNG